MEPVGLLSLPVEIIHHIGEFLPVKDILSCSASCHYLRCAFNDNSVWKKHLPATFSSLSNEELCWKLEICLQNTITPLCENRITFMKKMILLNNWKNANFVEYRAKTSFSYASGVFNVTKIKGQAIYKERYLFLGRFINDIESDAIEVWDISQKPVLLTELKMNEPYYDQIYIVEDYLVVLECVQVKVYEIKISDKSLPLWFSFLISGNDVVFNEPFNHPGSHDIRCVGWNYSMIDNYLFASRCEDEPNSCVFHIWNIVNACKVGSFSPPIPGFSIQFITQMGSKWLLKMTKQRGHDIYHFQFDLQRQLFSNNVFLINKYLVHYMIYDCCMIFFASSEPNTEGWCSTICSVYDINNSKKLQERLFDNAQRNHRISCTRIINGKFVMLCNDGFHVVNALTLKTLFQFPCDGGRFVTHHLNIHGSVFVLTASRENVFEVWDITNKLKIGKKLHQVYTSHVYLNSSCTKLVCVGRYEITCFSFL